MTATDTHTSTATNDTVYTVARLPDWTLRLDALVRARLLLPFEWGGNDCFSWVADCAQAMTGTDVLAVLRGPRRTWQGAYKQHARYPGGLPSAMMRAGLQRVDPRLARRGDAVLIELPPFGLLAVCNGEVALAPGPQGLATVPMERALCGWRV